MAKITYANKVALNENPEIALINKVTDDDLNEIKSVVNTNDDNVGNLTNLTTTTKTNIVAAVNELNSDKAEDDIILVQSTEPTSDTNILWINDGQIGTPVSEITNSYSTSTGIGYSANYINNNVGVIESGSNANGNYIKYEDGTMICYNLYSNTLNITSQFEGVYYVNTGEITFPIEFYAKPLIYTQINLAGGGFTYYGNYTKTSFSGFVWKTQSKSSASVEVNWLAIGRWKA